MKIALVRQKYTDFGGAERYTAAIAEHLLRLGHEVHVFANEWKMKNDGSKDGRIVFHHIPILKLLSVFQVITFAVNVRRILKREQFDIIHSFERTLYQDIYRAGDGCHREWLIQRRKIDLPGKSVLHRINPLHIALLWIEKQIFKEGNYKAIIANSRRGKKEIMDLYGVPENRIHVIYTAVDSKRFAGGQDRKMKEKQCRQFGINPNKPILLFVGSGFQRKGLPSTLRSLALLPFQVHLIVVGKERLSPYQRLAGKLGVDSYVTFTGPISDVIPFYKTADLFIFPTIYEPFGNVCLEAMAAGLPVVTSRINGASEVIVEGENGCVIENPLNPTEIAAKIQQGLNMSRIRIAETNSHILNQLTWDNHVRQIIELYNAVQNIKQGDYPR